MLYLTTIHEVKRDVLTRVAGHINSVSTSCTEESTPEELLCAISAALDLLIAADAAAKTVSAVALVRKLLSFLSTNTSNAAASTSELGLLSISAKIVLSFPHLTPFLFHTDALVRSHVFSVTAALAGIFTKAAVASDVTTQISIIARAITMTSLGDGEALFRLAQLTSNVAAAEPARADDTGVLRSSEQAWSPLVTAFVSKILAAPQRAPVIALPLLIALAPALSTAAAFTQTGNGTDDACLVALLTDFSNAVLPALAAAAINPTQTGSTNPAAKDSGKSSAFAAPTVFPRAMATAATALLAVAEMVANRPECPGSLITDGALAGAVSLLAAIRPAYLAAADGSKSRSAFPTHERTVANATFAFVQALLRKSGATALPIMAKLGLLAECAAFLPASTGETSVLSAALWCCSMFHRDAALTVQLLRANVLPCYLSLTMHSDPVIRSVAAFSAVAPAGLMTAPANYIQKSKSASPVYKDLEGVEWTETLLAAHNNSFTLNDLMFVRDQVWLCFDAAAITSLISYTADLECSNDLASPVTREFRGFVTLVASIMLVAHGDVQAEVLAEGADSLKAISDHLSAVSRVRKAIDPVVRDTLERLTMHNTGSTAANQQVYVRLPMKNGHNIGITHVMSKADFDDFWRVEEYPVKTKNIKSSLIAAAKKS
mgnify:CR=1 FL=1